MIDAARAPGPEAPLRSLEADLREAHAQSELAGRFGPSGRRRGRPAARRDLRDLRRRADPGGGALDPRAACSSASSRTTGWSSAPGSPGPGERLELAQRPPRRLLPRPPARHRPRVPAGAASARSARCRACAACSTSAHNPLFRLPLSGDGAMALLEFCQQRRPGDRRARPRLHRPGLEHPLPRRPLPGPVRGGAQALRAAADAGVRRGVHPRPHARPGDRRVRLRRGADDRPDLRLGPLPARRASHRLLDAVAARTSRARNPRRWRSGRSTRSPASTSTRSRSRSPASGCWSPRCRRAASTRLADAPDFQHPRRRRRLPAARPALRPGTSSATVDDATSGRRAARTSTPREDAADARSASSAASTTPWSATRPTSRRRTRRCNERLPRALRDLPPASTRSACRSSSASSTSRSRRTRRTGARATSG